MIDWFKKIFGSSSARAADAAGDGVADHSDLKTQGALKLKIRDDVINLLNHTVKQQSFDVKGDFLLPSI